MAPLLPQHSEYWDFIGGHCHIESEININLGNRCTVVKSPRLWNILNTSVFEPLCLGFLISTLDFLGISTFTCMAHASFIAVPGPWVMTNIY